MLKNINIYKQRRVYSTRWREPQPVNKKSVIPGKQFPNAVKKVLEIFRWIQNRKHFLFPTRPPYDLATMTITVLKRQPIFNNLWSVLPSLIPFAAKIRAPGMWGLELMSVRYPAHGLLLAHHRHTHGLSFTILGVSALSHGPRSRR